MVILVPLTHGGFLRFEFDDGEFASVHIDDERGNEVVMWADTELAEDLSSVMAALAGAAQLSPARLIAKLGRTEVVDDCWI